jgi:hypothetical protein
MKKFQEFLEFQGLEKCFRVINRNDIFQRILLKKFQILHLKYKQT